jgi:hypothetical protein
MKISITMRHLFIPLLALLSLMAQAQTDTVPAPKAKKFHFGVTFINAWSSVVGNTPDHYYKPSLGGGVKVEYYPLHWLGLGLGAHFQQRGAGVTQPDTGFTAPSMNTYRMRFRMNCIDVPVSVILRSPAILKRSIRFSGSFGVAPTYMFGATYNWISAEDGFHDITEYTSDIQAFDFQLMGSVGIDVNAWGTVFQLRYVNSFGTMNIYRPGGVFAGYDGRNVLHGIGLGWMY